MSTAHKITPSNPRLASLLSDVTKGNVKIPVFQREYVWEDEQIMSLLDSIYHGYPVGSLLFWSTKERLRYERDVGGFKLPETPEDYPVQYVLDGQQRLTTLYGVFNSDAPTANAELAERFDVSFVPSSGEFAHSSTVDPAKAIKLRDILDTTKLLPELKRFSGDEHKIIGALTERFKDYEFPVVTIRDRSNQEVCRIFQRINSSGTSLSTLELLAAWTWSEQFDLRTEIQALLDRLADKGYEQLEKTEVMRCLTAVVMNGIDTDALVDVKPADLVAGMSTVKQAIYAAIDFLDKELHIKNAVFLPFPIMMVPLVRFFSKCLKPSADQRKELRRWFWHCAFTQRYRAGTNRLVTDDLGKMNSLADGKPAFNNLNAVVPSELFTKTWRINSTVAKATICLLAQFQPRTFLTGAPVDLSDALSAYNARQFHHIYPKAFLGEAGIPFHEANVIANICMLTADDNVTISDEDPASYIAKMPMPDRDDILARALVPAAHRTLSTPFAEFVAARAELLAQEATKLIAHG
jgi:hypothetical protein